MSDDLKERLGNWCECGDYAEQTHDGWRAPPGMKCLTCQALARIDALDSRALRAEAQLAKMREALEEIVSRYEAKSNMTNEEGTAWHARARAALEQEAAP